MSYYKMDEMPGDSQQITLGMIYQDLHGLIQGTNEKIESIQQQIELLALEIRQKNIKHPKEEIGTISAKGVFRNPTHTALERQKAIPLVKKKNDELKSDDLWISEGKSDASSLQQFLAYREKTNAKLKVMEETAAYEGAPIFDEDPRDNKADWHSYELLCKALGLEDTFKAKQNKDSNFTDAKVLDCTSVFKPDDKNNLEVTAKLNSHMSKDLTTIVQREELRLHEPIPCSHSYSLDKAFCKFSRGQVHIFDPGGYVQHDHSTCVLSEVVTTKGCSKTINLYNQLGSGLKNFGAVTVHVKENIASRNAVEMVFRRSHLTNKDLFSKSDPFIRISRISESGGSIPICKTAVIDNNLNPIWKPLCLSTQQIGVQDPYWTPPPGWTPGDCPSQVLTCAKEFRFLKEENAKIKRDMENMLSQKQLKEELQNLRREINVQFSKTQEEMLALKVQSYGAISQNLNIDASLMAPWKSDFDSALVQVNKQTKQVPLLERFALLLSVAIIWAYAHLLTASGAYKHHPEETQIHCHTDKANLISSAPWIKIPYPLQWGAPTFDIGHAFGRMAAVFVSMIESTGAYKEASRLVSATPPTAHVLSRGINWQGIGILLDGLFGTLTGPTVSVENVGLLGSTRVGSRQVVQISAGFMIFFSMFGKFGALFASIPFTIFAAIYCVLFGLVASCIDSMRAGKMTRPYRSIVLRQYNLAKVRRFEVKEARRRKFTVTIFDLGGKLGIARSTMRTWLFFKGG